MKHLKSLLVAASIAASLFVFPLHAQVGQLGSGQVFGNASASQARAAPTNVTALFDRALGSTRGAILERALSGWGIIAPSSTAGLPFVSNGTGADPGYQLLGATGGGTNNAFFQVLGPAGSIHNYTFPNADSSVAALNAIQTWTAAQSFTDGDLVLLGSSSGSTVLHAPATGGVSATFFPGADTVAGLAATQTLTNKTLNCANNTCSVRLPNDVTGQLPQALLPGLISGDLWVGNASGAAAQVAMSGDCTMANTGAITCHATNIQTVNYTIATTDCGKTVEIGTGSTGLLTLTLPASTGFAAGCLVTVKNGDTGRGKVLSGFPADFSSNILWPEQSGAVQIINGAWATKINPGKWKLSGSVTFNVNHASGVNANNDGLGTGSGAFATIQNAINVIQAQIDANGFTAGIQNAPETFTENVIFLGYAPIGANSPGIPIIGSPATPSNTVWQTTAGNTALVVRDDAIVALDGFKLVSTGSGSTGLSVSQGGTIDFKDIEFGTFTGGSHISATGLGAINYNGGTYVVSGNMSQHIFASGPAMVFIPNATISVPNALTFNNWYQGQLGAAFQIFGTTFTGTGSASGSTGAKYNVSLNASAQLNSTVLPGATAGSTSTGGQVAP